VPVPGVERGHAGADAVFGARDAREHQPVVIAIGARQAEAVVVVLELGPPQELAGLLVESREAAVEQARVHPAVANGDTTVVPTTADQVIGLGDVRVPLPDLLTRLGVEGKDVVVAGRDVHHPVDDQRISFETILGALA